MLESTNQIWASLLRFEYPSPFFELQGVKNSVCLLGNNNEFISPSPLCWLWSSFLSILFPNHTGVSPRIHVRTILPGAAARDEHPDPDPLLFSLDPDPTQIYKIIFILNKI